LAALRNVPYCSGFIVMRLVGLLWWTLGAVVAFASYWLLTVYVFEEFDRGYGQSTWLLLQLYVSIFFLMSGLAGCTAVLFVRKPAGSAEVMLLAGVAFAIAVIALSFAGNLVFPDQDMTVILVGGALLLGAASAYLMSSSTT
jgi:hypothetical protein